MTDINLKTLTPDTSLPTTGFLFGADSQASTNPSVYSTQTVATTLLGSTSLTGDTLTASAPVLDLAQTWNSSGTTFTGVRFNAAGSSSTNSAAASLLADFQIGGNSVVRLTKDGINTYYGANVGVAVLGAQYNSIEATWGTSATSLGAVVGNYGVYLANDVNIQWNNTNSSASVKSGIDLYIGRKAARNLRLGQADAATALAQTLSVQSVVAGATTNTPGADFTINGSQGLGSGAGGSIIFKVAPAGAAANPAQNGLSTALTIGSDRTLTVASDLYAGGQIGTSVARATASGFNTSGYVAFGTNPVVPDLIITRDAANTLAQRNSTAAQTFNVYNTYTDASNYERGFVRWSSNEYQIGTEALGTGTTRSIGIYQGATQIAQFSTGIIYINRALSFQPDNTYDIGASGANRPRSGYFANTVVSSYFNFSSAIQHNSNGTYMSSPGNGIFKVFSSDQATKGVLATASSTVATLPAAATAGAGGFAFVTDATMTMALGIGTAVVGGGANKVPVYSDGASWFIG